MIKFFRNIRQRLLRENRFTKYLIYAIGEIVLVVIGILIALQIGDFNEQRKKDEEARKILIQIQDELLNTVQGLERQRKAYRERDSLSDIIMADTLEVSDYMDIKNRKFSNITFQYIPFRIQKEGYKSYISKVDQFSDKYGKLEPALKSHYLDYEFYFEGFQNTLKELQHRQMTYARHQNWFREVLYSTPLSKEYAEYLANNQLFKNEVWEFQNNIYWNVSVGLMIQKTAIDLYKKIHEITNYPIELPEQVKNFYEFKSEKYINNLVGTYASENDSLQPPTRISYKNDSLKVDGYTAYFLDENEILYSPRPLGAEIYRFEPQTKTLISSTLFDQPDRLKKVND